MHLIGNIVGHTYVRAVFESNSAEIGGAVATYSTGPESSNTYVNCLSRRNTATATGGAVEASVGQDVLKNSSFVNNKAGEVRPRCGVFLRALLRTPPLEVRGSITKLPTFSVGALVRTTNPGVGDGLRLSGTVRLVNATFSHNAVQSKGPAISNIGNMEKMADVTFDDNFFVCVDGEYLDYAEVSWLESDSYSPCCCATQAWAH